MQTIYTKRLIIRALTTKDLEAFYLFASNEEVGPMAGWDSHKNINETKLILNQLIEEKEMWAITINDLLIGTINISFDKKRKYYELGFSLNYDYWNKGYMTEAILGVLNYVFNKTSIDRLIARHFEYNYRSKKVLEKVQFNFKKYEIDLDILGNEQLVSYYELTKKEYKEVNI